MVIYPKTIQNFGQKKKLMPAPCPQPETGGARSEPSTSIIIYHKTKAVSMIIIRGTNTRFSIKEEPENYSGVLGYNCLKSSVNSGSIPFYTKTKMLSRVIYKRRTRELPRGLRLQLPKSFSKLRFDTILHKNKNIVKSNIFGNNTRFPYKKKSTMIYEQRAPIAQAGSVHR